MNSGLSGLPSHFSKPNNLVGSSLALGTVLPGNVMTTGSNAATIQANASAYLVQNQPAINISQNWNNAAPINPFVGIYGNFNVIASGNASYLVILQRGGTTQFSVTEFGTLAVNVGQFGNVSTPTVTIGGSAANVITMTNVGAYGWSSSSNTALSPDLLLTRPAAATLQQGAVDVAAPVAQTTQVQSVIAGTANTAGVDWTQQTSRSTGTGLAGTLIYKTGFKGLSQNATVTVTAATPAVVTYTTHGFVPGQSGQFTTTTTLPSGLSLATTYYVLSTGLTASTFQVSLTPGGAAINCTDTGTGTHTFTTNTTAQNPASTVATIGPSGLTGSQTTPALDLTQTWNTSGVASGLRYNATAIASGAASLLLDLQVNAFSKGSIDKDGNLKLNNGTSGTNSQFGINPAGFFTQVTVSGSNSFYCNNNGQVGATSFSVGSASSATTLISSPSTGILQQGAADAAAAVAQTLRHQSVVAGTTDTAGADWTRIGSKGTGTAAGGNIIEQTGFSAKSTGSGQGTVVDRKVIVAKGKVLTSTVASSLFDIALPTLAMCGGQIEATIVCTNGTDMQSFTQTISYSAVNKGGVYTKSITASTGDKSVSAGTLTTVWSLLDGTNKVTVQLTPTTSLTPSTNAFLVYYSVKNNSEQATTIL